MAKYRLTGEHQMFKPNREGGGEYVTLNPGDVIELTDAQAENLVNKVVRLEVPAEPDAEPDADPDHDETEDDERTSKPRGRRGPR